MATLIQTFTGKVFDVEAPSQDDIVIEDIAHALAMTCRFNGHCRRFYSVAEHSVHVSRQVPPTFSLWGLLHDAAEAYVSDVSSPVKKLVPQFRNLEEIILRAVLDKFQLYPALPTHVVTADQRMLASEVRDLMPTVYFPWQSWLTRPYPADEVALGCWAPEVAERMFLDRYDEIMADLHG